MRFVSYGAGRGYLRMALLLNYLFGGIDWGVARLYSVHCCVRGWVGLRSDFPLNYRTTWMLCELLEEDYRVSDEKGIDKKLLVGAAHGFSSQFLNLFGFSISVNFV